MIVCSTTGMTRSKDESVFIVNLDSTWMGVVKLMPWLLHTRYSFNWGWAGPGLSMELRRGEEFLTLAGNRNRNRPACSQIAVLVALAQILVIVMVIIITIVIIIIIIIII